MSDEHFDNLHCDLALLRRHHEQARVADAPIFKFGDTFCAMQGKWDKRADQDELRAEVQGNAYLDKLIQLGAKLYSPYADLIAFISEGNHEASVLKHNQVSLVHGLAERLKIAGASVLTGPITGCVRLRVMLGSKTNVQCRDIHYHHGYGGGGEVTRGMIDNNRTRSRYMADIYYAGHIHRRNDDENVMLYWDKSGKRRKRDQLFLRGAAYKMDEEQTWHNERGGGARPLGGWWLDISYHRGGGYTYELDINSARAK